jgi:hypothetical protein
MRLEGWLQAPCPWPSFETPAARAPQDEAGMCARASGMTTALLRDPVGWNGARRRDGRRTRPRKVFIFPLGRPAQRIGMVEHGRPVGDFTPDLEGPGDITWRTVQSKFGGTGPDAHIGRGDFGRGIRRHGPRARQQCQIAHDVCRLVSNAAGHKRRCRIRRLGPCSADRGAGLRVGRGRRFGKGVCAVRHHRSPGLQDLGRTRLHVVRGVC